MTSYLAVTVHYINAEWELKIGLLSFTELEGSHTGENLGSHLYNILKDYCIENKVT
jgi:hypothetical protein